MKKKDRLYKTIIRKATMHLELTGLSYFEHMLRAIKFSLKSGLTSLIFAIHAIFPFVFEELGSKKIKEMHEEM